jgi:ubiquinone/menaquinone biosynthesis C-methylase UbiE
VLNLTAQEASVQYPSTFDVVTVFKYNVNFREKEAIAASFSRIVKADGVVIITSVEKQRCYKGLDPALYIGDAPQRCFQIIEVKQVDYSPKAQEWLILCRKPIATSRVS